MLHPDQITGVVLAGGKSSRFGSNKALCDINGFSFLEHIITKLKPYTHEIIISGYREEYKNIGLLMLPDEFESTGPIGGIYTALKYCTTPWLLVLTCDMPLISNEVIMHLLASGRGERVIGWNFGECHGLFPLLISKDVLSDIKKMIGLKQYRIKQLLQLNNSKVIDIPRQWQHYFTNVNTHEDYKQIING